MKVLTFIRSTEKELIKDLWEEKTVNTPFYVNISQSTWGN
jgi:hypothetical protein